MESGRYILNPHNKYIVCGDDELVVKHGVRSSFSIHLHDSGNKRILGKVIKYLKALKAPVSLEEILENEDLQKIDKNDMSVLIETFIDRRILINADEDILTSYLGSILNGHTKLSGKRIGVLGVGALGSRIIRHIADFCVGHITFCDNRKVNHQKEYRFWDMDLSLFEPNIPHVEIMRSYLTKRGYTTFTSLECSIEDKKALALFQDTDFVIVNSEYLSPLLFHTANRLALGTGKSWLSVYTDGSAAVISPLFSPGETLCYSEFEMQVEAGVLHKDEYLLYKDYIMENDSASSTSFVLPTILDIVSSYTTYAVAKFLIGADSPISERAVFIDFEDLSIDYQNILRLPRCPSCIQFRPAYKNSFG